MNPTSWDQAQTIAHQYAGTGGGLFVRLAAHGDKVVGAFVGEPYLRPCHWTGRRFEACAGDGCPTCPSKRPALRVAINFYVPAERAMKIIEGGSTWFDDVLKARKRYGLDTRFFEIERHGMARDPLTFYSILLDREITEADRQAIAALELHDLPRVVAGGTVDRSDADRPVGSEPAAGPRIGPHEASALVMRLKALPPEAASVFSRKFRVRYVRELAAADLEAAQAFLASLEARCAALGGEHNALAAVDAASTPSPTGPKE